MPDKLAELQRLFLIEAARYNVLPLDDRRVERFNADLAGRPQLVRGNSQLLFGGMGRLSENSVLVLKNKSHAVTAQVVVPEDGAQRRDHRPGRRVRRLEPLPARRPAGVLLQPLRAAALQDLRRAARSRPASTRCAWSSPTTAAASARAATSRSTSTASRSGTGRVEATVPMLFSGRRDLRRRQRQRHAGERRPRAAGQPSSRAGSAGCRSTSTKPPRTSTT